MSVREDIIINFVLHDTTHRNSKKKKIVLEKIVREYSWLREKILLLIFCLHDIVKRRLY